MLWASHANPPYLCTCLGKAGNALRNCELESQPTGHASTDELGRLRRRKSPKLLIRLSSTENLKAGELRRFSSKGCAIDLRNPRVLSAAEAWQSGRLHPT